eukprot:3942823-Amphidinium_carterae.3
MPKLNRATRRTSAAAAPPSVQAASLQPASESTTTDGVDPSPQGATEVPPTIADDSVAAAPVAESNQTASTVPPTHSLPNVIGGSAVCASGGHAVPAPASEDSRAWHPAEGDVEPGLGQRKCEPSMHASPRAECQCGGAQR